MQGLEYISSSQFSSSSSGIHEKREKHITMHLSVCIYLIYERQDDGIKYNNDKVSSNIHTHVHRNSFINREVSSQKTLQELHLQSR